MMQDIADLRRLIRPHLRQITRRPENADQRAQQLRALHQVGQTLTEHLPKQSAYTKSPFAELGKMFDRSGSWMLKVKQFAERYSTAQLEGVCKLSDKVGFTHVQHLLAVKDRRLRASLQLQTARSGWSVKQLQREIRRCNKPVRGGGRRPANSSDPAMLLLDLVERSQAWRRFVEAVVIRLPEAQSDSPDAVEGLKSAIAELKAVEETARAAEQQLRTRCRTRKRSSRLKG